MKSRYVSKQGSQGTKYLYRFSFRAGSHAITEWWYCWAYDRTDAWNRWDAWGSGVSHQALGEPKRVPVTSVRTSTERERQREAALRQAMEKHTRLQLFSYRLAHTGQTVRYMAPSEEGAFRVLNAEHGYEPACFLGSEPL